MMVNAYGFSDEQIEALSQFYEKLIGRYPLGDTPKQIRLSGHALFLKNVSVAEVLRGCES